MACITVQQNTTPAATNSITDLLKRIEKMQKEAIATNTLGGCNTCVIAPIYNTKPIAVYTCNGILEATIDTNTTTTRFRVEEVKNDLVILRLLQVNGNETTCTNYTITVKISCICCIQCFDAIACTIECALAA